MSKITIQLELIDDPSLTPDDIADIIQDVLEEEEYFVSHLEDHDDHIEIEISRDQPVGISYRLIGITQGGNV
jgi:ferritin